MTTTGDDPADGKQQQQREEDAAGGDDGHETLKYSLLGPSLLKAGQDSVDQTKVSEIIYDASKGSKYFNREEEKDKILTSKIEHILARKARLEEEDEEERQRRGDVVSHELREADKLMAELELSRDLSQHIVHVDCDAFYAAVEQLDRPELADVPFAVGGGVLTTCNYLARRFGCRSGMAGFVAKKLCPQLVLLKPNFDKYIAKADEVREVLAEYDGRFESASIDEAYLNITAYCAEHGGVAPADAVAEMRARIRQKAGITVSAGIAANARLAKICSNINKPDGQYTLPNDRAAVLAFMADLPCRKVNGVGRVFERELAAVGIKTCGDIHTQRRYLRRLFGDKAYEFLLACHLGLGRTRIQPAEDYERKSVGTESTFGELSGPDALRRKLRWTADELEKDLRRAACKGKTLVLKVKLHTFEVYTRQVPTPKAVFLADDLYNCALPVLARLEQEIPGMKLRLLGLRCTHLVSTKKPDTMAFFGFKRRAGDPPDQTGAGRDDAGDAGEWEQWPGDDEEGDAELGRHQEAAAAAAAGTEDGGDGGATKSDGGGTFRRHGKEILPNPKGNNAASPAPPEEWWDCPICGRPQAVDERLFNEHIDLCLSRQTIKDAVQKEAQQQQPQLSNRSTGLTPESKRANGASERKRGRPSAAATANDPRQKKLCFG